MKEVTMSMYPGATSKDAHWTSFFDPIGVANTAPLDDEDLAEESDSNDVWEESIGLSVIVPTIQSSLHINTGRYPSSPNLESAALVFSQHSSSTDNHGGTMRVEPAGLPIICE